MKKLILTISLCLTLFAFNAHANDICTKSFNKAKQVFKHTNGSYVIERLIAGPWKDQSNAGGTICNASVTIGGMYMPRRDINMQYMVIQSNGYFSVEYAIMTHSLD